MLSILDLTNLLKEGLQGNFYPLSFPADSPDDSTYLVVTGGSAIYGGVGTIFLQVVTRDKHPSNAEKQIMTIRSFLDGKTDFYLAEKVQIVAIQSNDPMPLYLGKDENKRHLFSHNFKLILGV